MGKAHYEIIDDGSYYGEIQPCHGVWATGTTLEACRQELQEVLGEWLLLKIREGDSFSTIEGLELAVITS